MKRQEHLTALTALAEKTVIDANNMSQAMMKKLLTRLKQRRKKSGLDRNKKSNNLPGYKAEAKTAAEKEPKP